MQVQLFLMKLAKKIIHKVLNNVKVIQRLYLCCLNPGHRGRGHVLDWSCPETPGGGQRASILCGNTFQVMYVATWSFLIKVRSCIAPL